MDTKPLADSGFPAFQLLKMSKQLPRCPWWKLQQTGRESTSQDWRLAVPSSQWLASSGGAPGAGWVEGHEEPCAAVPLILSPAHPMIRAVQDVGQGERPQYGVGVGRGETPVGSGEEGMGLLHQSALPWGKQQAQRRAPTGL